MSFLFIISHFRPFYWFLKSFYWKFLLIFKVILLIIFTIFLGHKNPGSIVCVLLKWNVGFFLWSSYKIRTPMYIVNWKFIPTRDASSWKAKFWFKIRSKYICLRGFNSTCVVKYAGWRSEHEMLVPLFDMLILKVTRLNYNHSRRKWINLILSDIIINLFVGLQIFPIILYTFILMTAIEFAPQ